MDTIFAPLTPVVNSAVILVRISGNHVKKVFSLLTRFSDDTPVNFESLRVYHCNFCVDGVAIDDVVAYFFQGPNSYTGEDVLEISFHGNPKIVSLAFNEFLKLGFRFAEPGEFTKRAFLNGKIDLSQAEAVAELINAKSEYAIACSYKQLKGGVKEDLADIKNMLIDMLSIVEVYVDFPDEDIEPSHFEVCKNLLYELIKNIDDLLITFEKLKVFKTGVTVAIVGKPNVGKSSLLNVLLNEDRAIVSEHAGTTRDFIEESIVINGLPVRFIDTAGIRETDQLVEIAGINLAMGKIKSADLVIALFDASNELDSDDYKILELIEDIKCIKVGNKADKGLKAAYNFDLLISAKQRDNIDKLLNIIYENVVDVDFEKYHHFSLITDRHYRAFLEVKEILDSMRSNFDSLSLDLISIDLHYCLDKISEITGEKYTNELLDNIFSRFCIGK